MLLQIATFERKRFLDEFIDIERGLVLAVSLEVRANAFDHLSRTMAICGDAPESLLGSRRDSGVERSRKRKPASALVIIAVNGCLTSWAIEAATASPVIKRASRSRR